ncbi:MAG: transcription antitermination factor NusB [Motilibacteraceae bacterium]
MGARSKARKHALDVLYAADLRGVEPSQALADRERDRTREGQPALPDYAVELVNGVVEHRERIDELLGTYSQGWTLDRMPAVDRTALRIGAYELLWRDDVPDVVAVDEAVDMVRELSTDESPSFVNGLLARLMELKPSLAL